VAALKVDGLDVFWWVLLTAGTICFPIAVFTFFCLRQRWKIQKIENEYLYADPSKKKNIERGFLGPYAESKESINEPRANKVPEIVVQPYGASNKVRFRDDPSAAQDSSNNYSQEAANQLPALMAPTGLDGDEGSQAADLRGLKNAVNFFGKNLANKKQQSFSNRSNFSGPQSSRYVHNPMLQESVDAQNDVYSSADTSDQPIVYSLASSQPQGGVQATLSQANNLVPDNIYSQVVAQNRASNLHNSAEYEEQPVYMNTAQIDSQYDQYGQQQQPPRGRNASNWDDSSV